MSKTQKTEPKQILQVETEIVEYKEKVTDSLEKEVVSFLNANGGILYIGVKDNGEIVGIKNVDKTQLQIKDRLIFGVSPAILSLISINTEFIDGKTVLKISIKEGSEKPYYIKSKGLSESGAFIRIGNSAQPMTNTMIYSFQNKSFPKSLITIESPEQELTFADLFIHYRRFNKPLNDNTFSKTLNFLTKDGKYNYLAYLMADNNQVSVRFARFNDAGERFELIEKGIEYGNCCLITAIQRILDRFDVENITLSKLTGAAHRIDKRLVDEKCLREVIINAFAHNDYSYGMLPIFEVFQNRFAIRSYGGLVPQLTIHDFFLGVSALRNSELMRILKDVELVEALGFGIRGILEIYDRNIFEFTDTTMYVQLPFDKDVAGSKDESKGISRGIGRGKSRGKSREKILQLITENSKISVPEIAEIIGLSIKGVEKNILILKREGVLSRTTDTKSGEWVVKER
ncbi:MAG: putative DNA binding domain-containing protein [Lentimicrobiaceae bacterium]|nr:putative DNA binding domain-containing protein [Lentimicrobiaceae bacterium]